MDLLGSMNPLVDGDRSIGSNGEVVGSTRFFFYLLVESLELPVKLLIQVMGSTGGVVGSISGVIRSIDVIGSTNYLWNP